MKLELEHDADRHTEVLAAGAAIAVKHHPVSGATKCHIPIKVDVDATASQNRHPIARTAYTGERSAGVISTDQGMHEGRVGLIRAQCQLGSERVGVVVIAHTTLGGKLGTETGRNPKGVFKFSVRPKIEPARLEPPFQVRE